MSKALLTTIVDDQVLSRGMLHDIIDMCGKRYKDLELAGMTEGGLEGSHQWDGNNEGEVQMGFSM